MPLPDDTAALLRRPVQCHIATIMPDGSPQLTETWVDTDGSHVLINIVQGCQKDKNTQRDPRVAINVCDPDNPSQYVEIRGRVVGSTTDGATEHIESLSQKYLGGPYPWFGGRDQTRLILTIAADRVRSI